MSSMKRRISRAVRNEPVPPHSEVALLMLEATCCAELEEVFAAIKSIHSRYCASCGTGGSTHMHAETFPW